MISIITPTYNRSYTLDRLYESLKKQSSYNFQWIIIDDGSFDDTKTKIERWQKEEVLFEIIYKYQLNHGKHTAVNRGVSIAKGDYCFIVDSDDDLAVNAISIIENWIKETNSLSEIAGIAGLKAYRSTKEPIGGMPKFPKGITYIDAKNTERAKYKLMTDKAEIYRTSILKRFPFKEFDGENFLSEDTVWNEIAYNGYYVRWYNDVIYYCEYLEDGLTNSNNNDDRLLKNFNGFTYYCQQRIKCFSGYIASLTKGKYFIIARKKGLTIDQIKRALDSSTFTLCVGIILYNLKRLIKP